MIDLITKPEKLTIVLVTWEILSLQVALDMGDNEFSFLTPRKNRRRPLFTKNIQKTNQYILLKKGFTLEGAKQE